MKYLRAGDLTDAHCYPAVRDSRFKSARTGREITQCPFCAEAFGVWWQEREEFFMTL